MQVVVMFIRLLGSAATDCVRSRQASIQACGLCRCLFSMVFMGVVFQVCAELATVFAALEAQYLQHSRDMVVSGHVNEGRVCVCVRVRACVCVCV